MSRLFKGARASLLLVLFAAGRAAAGGYLDAPDAPKQFHPFAFCEAGIDLNLVADAGCLYEPWRSWEAGLELRSWATKADKGYDLIPEVDFQVRKLWLGAEDRESLRSSEYVSLVAGMFPGYRKVGPGEDPTNIDFTPGMQPLVRVALGKYWMPFASSPLGFDIDLSLTHSLLNLHPPHFVHIDYFSVSISIFYLP